MRVSSSARMWGFTLLEILTTMIVIGILFAMSVQIYASIRQKAERALCQGNLRNLYATASAYLMDQKQWPQVAATDLKNPQYALDWINTFKPYGLTSKNWICPSVQYALGNINYDVFPRLDYFPAGFGDGPRTPYLYPSHPWFVERGDVHGDGNLAILANGQVKSLQEIVRDSQSGGAVDW